MQVKESMAEARSVDVAGASIRVRDTGGPGQAVLFTHGIGGSLELWNRQFETPAEGFRMIAWDMPGHGLSDTTPDSTDLNGIARTAWTLLDTLGVQQALLVGNSLGGAVSLRMAGQAPQRASALLLAAAATLGRETVLPFRLMTLPGLGELMTKPGPMAVKQQVKAIVHRPKAITPEVLAAIERNVMRTGGAAHFLALLRQITRLGGQSAEIVRQSEQLLQGLRVPVTIVHGQQDAVLPVAHSQRAHQAVAGSVLALLPDCGHTPQLEQPQQFNRLLRELVVRPGA